jgi:hypothetical protein
MISVAETQMRQPKCATPATGIMESSSWQRGWQVRYWRLPLTQTCAEFAAAGFWVERPVEPLPVPEMALACPQDHAKLLDEPGFVTFRLVKALD